MKIEYTVCPCCGLRSYYDDGGVFDEEGGQVSPHRGECFICQYAYVQDCNTTPQKQVRKYKLWYWKTHDDTVKQFADKVVEAAKAKGAR